MTNKSGIDKIRYAARLFSELPENFNERFTANQLLAIADACKASDWDFLPHEWTERQISEAIHFGIAPEWQDFGNKYVPRYERDPDATEAFEVSVNWRDAAKVTVYAENIAKALAHVSTLTGQCVLSETAYICGTYKVDYPHTINLILQK